MSAVAWSVRDGVAQVTLTCPQRGNALEVADWHALRDVFDAIDHEPTARVAVLRGQGEHFCIGIDASVFDGLRVRKSFHVVPDQRERDALQRCVFDLQDCVGAIERCRVPVIAAIHGMCFGGGMDIASACDVRLVTRESRFSTQEVDLAITADLGVLHRLPRIVGEGRARELALTAREFDGAYAAAIGFATEVHGSLEPMLQAAAALAASLAARPTLTLRGIKRVALAARNDGPPAGMSHLTMWNAAAHLSRDLADALAEHRARRAERLRD